MERVIFHIGPHKTGSTYLQKKLLEHSDALLEEGIYYPDNHWRSLYGHHYLVDRGMINEFRRSVEDIVNAYGKAKTLVVSTENFDRLKEESIQKLQEQVAQFGMEAKIVFYLRRAEAVLFSFWQENVKSGRDGTLTRFLLQHLSRPFDSDIVNPARVLDRWTKVFGINNVVVFDYDRHIQERKNLFLSFTETVLQIDSEKSFGETSNELVNKSLSIEETEVLRAVNAIDRVAGNKPGVEIRTAFLNIRAQSNVYGALAQKVRQSLEPFDVGAIQVIEKLRREILERYRHCILEVAEYAPDFELNVPNERWIMAPGAFDNCTKLQRTLRMLLD